jgi:CheY-like chemotaxis protein
VVLPCAVEQTQINVSPGVGVIPPDHAHVQTGLTVLIVEDEAALVAPLSRMLQRRGYSVLEASDGTAALTMLRAQEIQIDAVLLDVNLPGASSREVLEEARRLRPNLVVILASAYSLESVANSFAGLDVEHFIRKPFRIDDLISLLGGTLSARSPTASSRGGEKWRY